MSANLLAVVEQATAITTTVAAEQGPTGRDGPTGNTGPAGSTMLFLSGDPTSSDVPAGTFRLCKNTVTKRVTFWMNDGTELTDLWSYLNTVLPAGGTIDLPPGSGELKISEGTFGASVLFLIGGGDVTLVKQGSQNKWVVSGSPPSGTLGLYFTGSVYRIVSGFAADTPLYVVQSQTRPFD